MVLFRLCLGMLISTALPTTEGAEVSGTLVAAVAVAPLFIILLHIYSFRRRPGKKG